MNAQERLIKLDAAPRGLSLSRPVVDAHGRVLLAPGCELTESAIQSLRRHHVETVWVRDAMAGVSPDAEAAESVRRQHHRQRLARLFRNVRLPDDSKRLLTLLAQYRGIDPP